MWPCVWQARVDASGANSLQHTGIRAAQHECNRIKHEPGPGSPPVTLTAQMLRSAAVPQAWTSAAGEPPRGRPRTGPTRRQWQTTSCVNRQKAGRGPLAKPASKEGVQHSQCGRTSPRERQQQHWLWFASGQWSKGGRGRARHPKNTSSQWKGYNACMPPSAAGARGAPMFIAVRRLAVVSAVLQARWSQNARTGACLPACMHAPSARCRPRPSSACWEQSPRGPEP